MKEITFNFQGKKTTFQVVYDGKSEGNAYYFLECKENPSARGFFTFGFVSANS